MLKNRVALAHKRPRVHFLENAERIWSCGMPQKTYLVLKFVVSLFGQEKPYLVKNKPYLVIKSSEFLPKSRPLWEKPYLVMKFCV